jgi:IclR family pca regulon transcriptional regulator
VATASWTHASKLEVGPEFVESLARGLTVLTALGHGPDAMPLAAVANTTGLARATARRALITLEHLGYVGADGADRRLFRLTPRVLELGFAHLSRLTLPQIAQPHLADLVRRVQDSASMAVLTDQDILYVARVPTVRIMSVSISVGTLLPAYATAMGRVLLADLAPDQRALRLAASDITALTRRTVTDPGQLADILTQAGKEGFALVDEELEQGLRSLAVPVRDRGGRAVAAVNVSLHAGRASAEESAAELLPALREAAARIEVDLHTASRHVRVPLR